MLISRDLGQGSCTLQFQNEFWSLTLCHSCFSCDVIAVMLMVINKRFLISFFCLHHQNGRHDFVISVSRWIGDKPPLISNQYEHMKGKPESEDQNMFNSSWFSQALNNILIYQLIYYVEQYKCPIWHMTFSLRKCLGLATLQIPTRDKVFNFA